MRLVIITLSLASLASFMISVPNSPNIEAAGDRPEKHLRHIVLYKFKDDVRPEQVQEVIAAFAALPKKIDIIVSLEHGPNVSQEGKSDGPTYGFVVTFKNEADRDIYIKHPAHLDYVNIVKDRCEKVVVFDYWAAE